MSNPTTTPSGMPEKKLSDEDLARVNEYLNSTVHQYERAPFRPWLLMTVLTVIVTGLTVISLIYAWIHGVPRS
ncbi:MAG TPA: DUF3094 family protein [Pseudomonadales bacterium]|nr:DUF3094 family protein [Pseudomonadales bacterium]